MLKRLWNFLFHACKHEWETMETRKHLWNGEFSQGNCIRVILKCKKCGDWKKKDLK